MNLITRARVAMFGAEFFGTMILVLLFIVLARTTAVSYFVATSVGVTMAAIYMLFARVSGAHANPAVTFGLWTARKIDTLRAIVFIIAQALGALAAWGIYDYLVHRSLPKMTNVWDWRVFVAELIGAAIVTMAFTAVNNSRDNMFDSAATVGAALFVGVMLAALAVRANSVDLSTGQSIYKGFANPAAALATKNFSVVYILGPLAGGLVGANIYNELFGKGAMWTGRSTTTAARKKK